MKREVLAKLLYSKAIVETVLEIGGNCPEGNVYAAMMSYVSLHDFTEMLEDLKTAGALTSPHRHLLCAGPNAWAMVDGINKIIETVKTTA